jgi:hypothetical protein
MHNPAIDTIATVAIAAVKVNTRAISVLFLLA